MLHAYSDSEDPEPISEEMNAAQTAQASQESCSMTHTGDFLGRLLENVQQNKGIKKNKENYIYI